MEPSGLGPGFGMAASLVAALAWTLVSLIARDLATQFPSFSLNIIRSAGASVLLVPIALGLGDVRALGQISPLAWTCLVLSVLIALGIGDTAFFESTRFLGLARAMTISTAGYPLLASVLALWWFGERISVGLGVGAVVTLGGLVLIVSEGGSEAPPGTADGRRWGLGLAVVAAIAWAVSAALMKPPVREIDPLTIQAVRMPLSTLLPLGDPVGAGNRTRALGPAPRGRSPRRRAQHPHGVERHRLSWPGSSTPASPWGPCSRQPRRCSRCRSGSWPSASE